MTIVVVGFLVIGVAMVLASHAFDAQERFQTGLFYWLGVFALALAVIFAATEDSRYNNFAEIASFISLILALAMDHTSPIRVRDSRREQQ